MKEEKKTSENVEFVKKIVKKNKDKKEYKIWTIENVEMYNTNNQEYYYSIR